MDARWLVGAAGKHIRLKVNAEPKEEGAREETVVPTAEEQPLYYLNWVLGNIEAVEKATDGKVGYIYVQSTGTDAQNEMMRQFMGQWKKEGLVIDERWNSGGQIPDRFIELLHRPIVAYWAVRDGPPQQPLLLEAASMLIAESPRLIPGYEELQPAIGTRAGTPRLTT